MNIMDSSRLSLHTVPWVVRVFAILLTLIIGMALVFPIGMIHSAAVGGEFARVPRLWLNTVGGMVLPFMFFYWAFPIALIFWGLPALVLNHLALRLRLNAFGFVAAGVLTGMLGLALAGLGVHALNHDPIGFFRWSRFLTVLENGAPTLGLTGGVAGYLAWGLMWFNRTKPE